MKNPRLTFRASSIPLYFEELDYPSPRRDDWPKYAPDDEGYGWIAGSLITENGESNFYLARGTGDASEVTEIPGIGLLINIGGCCHMATAGSIRSLPYPWGGWIDTRVTPEGTVALCHHLYVLIITPDGTYKSPNLDMCDIYSIESLSNDSVSLRGTYDDCMDKVETRSFAISSMKCTDGKHPRFKSESKGETRYSQRGKKQGWIVCAVIGVIGIFTLLLQFHCNFKSEQSKMAEQACWEIQNSISLHQSESEIKDKITEVFHQNKIQILEIRIDKLPSVKIYSITLSKTRTIFGESNSGLDIFQPIAVGSVPCKVLTNGPGGW